MEELDKLLVGDLEPVIADLPTVPKDDIKDIDDQLPDVPTTVPTIIYYGTNNYLLLQASSSLFFFVLQEPKVKTKTKSPVAVAAS